MKIPYPGDLNPIEIAVWAAEFTRVRARAVPSVALRSEDDVVSAVEAANAAVDDLRHLREHR